MKVPLKVGAVLGLLKELRHQAGRLPCHGGSQ